MQNFLEEIYGDLAQALPSTDEAHIKLDQLNFPDLPNKIAARQCVVDLHSYHYNDTAIIPMVEFHGNQIFFTCLGLHIANILLHGEGGDYEIHLIHSDTTIKTIHIARPKYFHINHLAGMEKPTHLSMFTQKYDGQKEATLAIKYDAPAMSVLIAHEGEPETVEMSTHIDALSQMAALLIDVGNPVNAGQEFGNHPDIIGEAKFRFSLPGSFPFKYYGLDKVPEA